MHSPAHTSARGAFDTLVHRAFLKHSMRVKKSPLFLTANQTHDCSSFRLVLRRTYSGSANVSGRYLSCTFVESQKELAEGDVAILISGGAFELIIMLGLVGVRNKQALAVR